MHRKKEDLIIVIATCIRLSIADPLILTVFPLADSPFMKKSVKYPPVIFTIRKIRTGELDGSDYSLRYWTFI